jgi:hypothetical protein
MAFPERFQKFIAKPWALLVIPSNCISSIVLGCGRKEYFKFHFRFCNLAMTISQLLASSRVYIALRF